MVTLPAPLSTAKSNVMAPLISTGTTNIPESSFNGTSTKEDDFLFGTGANGGVVVTTFGGPASDAAAFIAGAGSKSSTVSFVQCVAASSAACFNSVGSSFCVFILISSTSAEKWSACPQGYSITLSARPCASRERALRGSSQGPHGGARQEIAHRIAPSYKLGCHAKN